MDARVIWILHITIVICLCSVVSPSRPSSRRRHRHRPLSVDSVSQSKVMLPRDTTDDEDLLPDTGSGMELTESYDKEDPRKISRDVVKMKIDCCSIGRQAAGSGLHCNAQVHAARLNGMNRTSDYVHFIRQQSSGKQGRLRRAFVMCVYNRKPEFYKCCKAVKDKANEMVPRNWYRGSHVHSGTLPRYHFDRRPYYRGYH